MKEDYIVLFEDGTTATVKAYDTSEAWELALDIPNAGKILDVFMR